MVTGLLDRRDNEERGTALLSQIPFGAVIGGPLKAAVDAQGAAALACYDFISKVGFEEVGTGNEKTTKVRDITFLFERTGEAVAGGGTPPKATVRLTVPLLTIMPLPFIRIESMTVNFKASISALDSREQTDSSSTTGQLDGSATIGFGLWKVNVGGSVSSKKDSTATNTSKYSVEHTMDISMHAVQDDMPAGLAKVLSIMTDAITVSRG
jgi:hypothetical protein